jgi:DNA-binding CsgD family transcriptional regulator
VAHVLSMRSGKRKNALNGGTAAALFVQPIQAASPSALEVLARTFRLTAGEVRVLAGVMTTGSVAEIAATLGLAPATVKTHLNRLLAKTGTRRQADLVRLAAGYRSPFAP